MWNKDSSRRPSMTLPRNLSPGNAFPSSPRQFPPPPVSSSTYAPPRRPFFRNTFTPVRSVSQMRDNSPSRAQQSSDAGLQSSFPFAKHHALHRTGGVSPLSSSEILRAPYSPGQYTGHQANKPFLKTELNMDQQFSFQNSPPPHQIPFLSERKHFGGIPFISDASADCSSPYSNHGVPVPSAVKHEEDSLDYFYNRHTPSDENRESTPSRSFEKENSSLDNSVFSQKSDDIYLPEGNRCEPNVNEDSQSRSSFPVIGSPADTSTRKVSASFFAQDSHHESGDSEESSSKRLKLSHNLGSEPADLQESEGEKRKREDDSIIGDSVEKSSKCQKPDHDAANDVVTVEKSELEKHITEILEPVVGLDYLLEFKKENVPPSLYTYKCSLCKCSILAKHVLMHILGVKHRLRYLKSIDESEHQRITKLGASQDELASIVVEAVAELEVKHGRGSVKVVCVPSSETKNSEENLEDSVNISPTVTVPSIVPPADDLLLVKIPEPPDLKLLNDILSTARVSKDFFQYAGTGKNEELPKEGSPKFKAETAESKWQLDCEIPPPPLLPFTEGASSPWNQDTSPVETSPGKSPTDTNAVASKSPSDSNAATSHPPQTSSSSKAGAPQKYASPEHGQSVFPMDWPQSPVKNENSEVKDTSASECSNNSTSRLSATETAFPSSDDLKLKNDAPLECGLDVLPKIPLIGDTVDDPVDRSMNSLSINIPAPFNDMPAEGTVLTEEEEELGKAAIFEHLSLCTITNEAEASLIEGMICTMSEMYFAYKLRDLPKSESESLLQALRSGEKEGIDKLTSILYHHSATDEDFSESDGNLNGCEENNVKHNDDLSSPLQSVKAEEGEVAKSDSPSTQENDGSTSVINTSSSHELNNNSVNSPSSLADEAKLVDSTNDVEDSKDISVSEKCYEENSASKDGENPQLTFMSQPPPPPPPLPPAESESQIAVSEQPVYSQASTYGGWPMAYYSTATQAGGYMYWHSQNMGGMDSSVMNTQYMIQAQNSDTNLYAWCQQAPPPLPPPPPPPPPPPTSCAP